MREIVQISFIVALDTKKIARAKTKEEPTTAAALSGWGDRRKAQLSVESVNRKPNGDRGFS